MIKAIMAIDDKEGVSKNGTMPWPKNSTDLRWFKTNTLNQVIIMGRLTWDDPVMPSTLKDRINILVTSKDKMNYIGADHCISGDLLLHTKNFSKEYATKDIFIIGGPNIINQLFEIVEEFYLTRVYGDFDCDKKLDYNKIKDSMKLSEKIQNDPLCHFEIWKK